MWGVTKMKEGSLCLAWWARSHQQSSWRRGLGLTKLYLKIASCQVASREITYDDRNTGKQEEVARTVKSQSPNSREDNFSRNGTAPECLNPSNVLAANPRDAEDEIALLQFASPSILKWSRGIHILLRLVEKSKLLSNHVSSPRTSNSPKIRAAM